VAPTLDGSSPGAVYNDANNTTTSVVTASFTPPSGAVIVAKAATADSATLAVSSITSSGPTMTSRVSNAAGSHCAVAIYTGIGAGAAITVTANFTGTGAQRALVVEVWTSAQLAATPATHQLASSATGAPSDTITTTGTGSVVSWLNPDWSAIDGTSRTYRSSATETGYHFLTGFFTVYNAYQAAASAGSQTYGLTAPTGQTWNLAAIEIQASGSAPAIPPILTMPTRRA
jgi:hypothetical protein